MARFEDPTPETEAAYRAWLAERPESVRVVAERFDPWTLYRLKTTGQRVTILAFFEDGTMRVGVSGKYNFVTHDRAVFGINPDDLEECDLPPAGVPTGTMMSDQALEENIDAMRVLVRPDLWVMGPDGAAIRRNR